jgi:hypothetical protein
MIKKLVQNQKKYSSLSIIILTGLFLFLNLFQFEWFIKMGIAVVYFLILVLCISYGRGGLPLMVMILSYYGFFAAVFGVSAGLGYLTSQDAFIGFSSLNNVVIAVFVFILIYTQFPLKIKHKTEVWLNQMGYLVTPDVIQPIIQLGPQQKFSAHYSTYNAKRSNKILRTKPTHIRNAQGKQGLIRMTVYTLTLSIGFVLVFGGIMDYTSGQVLYSTSYYVTLIGLEFIIYGFFVLRDGFKAAFRGAAIGSTVLLVLSIALDQVFLFYPSNMFEFMTTMIAFLMTVGIAAAFWIRHVLLNNTIAMLIFRRGELWLGLEVLLKETLPIIGYDHMVMIEITADEEFDLGRLMDLGPTIEVFAHFKKMIFAGLKYDPYHQIIELYFCTNNAVFAQRKLNVFFKRHFHYPFTMTVLNDPLAVIMERLEPTDQEVIEAMNRHTVLHYEDEDIDPTEIHHIVMFLHFKEATHMTQAKADLEVAGFTQFLMSDDRKYKDNPASESNGWFVISLETESRLGIDRINLVTRQIVSVIRPHDGMLNYWILGEIDKTTTENEPVL